MDSDKQFRQQIAKAIDWGEAHPDLAAAVADFPEELRGKVPPGFPHSAWQLLDHMRIALWDIVEFCRLQPELMELNRHIVQKRAR